MRLGKPKNAGDYRLETIDGVDVYLPRTFDTCFSLTIEVNSFFGFKNLYLEGWKLA